MTKYIKEEQLEKFENKGEPRIKKTKIKKFKE